MKKFLNLKTSRTMVFVLDGFATFLLGFLIHRLSALPLKYELLLLSPFFILFFLLLALSLRIRAKAGQIAVQLLTLCISISLFVVSFYISKGTDALRIISGGDKKTYTMSVVVLTDSPYQGIDDLAGGKIALNNKNDTKNQNITMEEIKKRISTVQFDIQESNSALVQALYPQDVEAILINEAYRSMFEVEKENFSEETRVIWSYEISEDATDVRKSVNVVNTPFTVYISGIDTYGPISTVSRTDVNMLVTVNPNTKQVVMTSIPRDAWVKLTNMDAYDKLTHSGIEGIENSISTIENFMGVEINYYARVNFSSVVAVVDALGGIDVYSDRAFGTIQEGMNHLDGQGALSFARERHAYDDMYEDSERGDQRRVENQQAVLEATIQKMISPAILKNYTKILDAIEGMFETNMSPSEMTSLIKMQLNDLASWDFVHLKVTGEYEYRYGGAYMPDWQLIYYMTDPESVKTCRDSIQMVLDNKRIS